jgi:uncharacterized phage infection (PIP) family protein YhgE
MKTKKFMKYLVIVVCAVVILVSALTVFGTWSFLSKATTTVVDLLNTVEKTALTVGAALDRVTMRMDQANQIAQEFQSGAEQVSQSVKDQGVILTLLPLVRDQKLKDAVQSIQDTYLGLKDTLESFAYWVEVTRQLPFLRLVGVDTGVLQSVGDKITNLQTLADKITGSVSEIRSQTASGVEKVATAVGNFNAQLADINNNLSQVRAQVQMVETTAGQLKTTIPAIFTSWAFFITIFLGWVIYSQVVFIRRSLLELKAIRELTDGSPQPDKEMESGK